ncbi:MAG: hypothetical protein IE909_04130 [Campylobacterales bacterium]|nr:hypothetical protein [Campylobacterales bacterium]
MMSRCAAILISLMFIGCGYKPVKNYAKENLGGKIYYELDVNKDDITKSVLLRNQIISLILNDLDGTIVHQKDNADVKLYVSLDSISHQALSTDNQGYAKMYRTTVALKFKYSTNDSTIKTIQTTGYYDYEVEPNSTLTKENKLNAIKLAMQDGIADLLSKIATSKK